MVLLAQGKHTIVTPLVVHYSTLNLMLDVERTQHTMRCKSCSSYRCSLQQVQQGVLLLRVHATATAVAATLQLSLRELIVSLCYMCLCIFENSIYAAAVGDWTTELFAKSLRSHNRPMWITACMPSTTDHTVKVSTQRSQHYCIHDDHVDCKSAK